MWTIFMILPLRSRLFRDLPSGIAYFMPTMMDSTKLLHADTSRRKVTTFAMPLRHTPLTLRSLSGILRLTHHFQRGVLFLSAPTPHSPFSSCFSYIFQNDISQFHISINLSVWVLISYFETAISSLTEDYRCRLTSISREKKAVCDWPWRTATCLMKIEWDERHQERGFAVHYFTTFWLCMALLNLNARLPNEHVIPPRTHFTTLQDRN